MKLIDIYPYLTDGQKLLVILPIDAGTEETFHVEVMRDQRFGSWRTEYGDWLEKLDLDIDNIFAGDSGNLMLTCKPKKLMPNPGLETLMQKFERQFGITPAKAKYLMERLADIVNQEVHEVIAHADFYMDPENYGVAAPEKEDEDDDGFTGLYDFRKQNSAVKTFRDFISRNTLHGGHTSAIEACRLMGIEWEADK